MGPPRKSQSALEYMMTYGWAILVIVIVAGVLYSLGIFSPSSSLSTTITGFSGLSVTQAGCVNSVNNQILELYVTNTVGYPVNITKINTTGNNGVDASQNISSILVFGGLSYIGLLNPYTLIISVASIVVLVLFFVGPSQIIRKINTH